MNKNQFYLLLEWHGVDPANVPDYEEFWALYATSFYEKLFGKIDNRNKLDKTYQQWIRNPKLNSTAKEALTFFYNIRQDEMDDPNYWDKVGQKSLEENKQVPMKAKLVKESLNESLSRYCDIYKTNDGKWYMDLANEEYGEWDDCTTYGPFNSEEKADQYLSDNHSNPGGMGVDDSGDREVPTASPNGSKVVNPRSGGYGGMSIGGYGRRW